MAARAFEDQPLLEPHEAEALLPEAEAQPRRGRGPVVRALAAAAAVAGAVAVLSTARGGGGGSVGHRAGLGAVQGKAAAAEGAPSTEESHRRFNARTRLGIEKDLSHYITAHLPTGAKPGGDHPPEHAPGVLFDHVIQASELDKELTDEELKAYKERFVNTMVAESTKKRAAGDWTLEYIKAAQAALDSQKPSATAALARSLNEAKLGWTAKMQPWMLKESKELYQSKLGRTPLTQKERDAAEKSGRQSEECNLEGLPLNFDARTKPEWEQCAEVTGNVPNQGHCGSCWAFAALSQIDSRLCYRTLAESDDSKHFKGPRAVLSRGYGAACAVPYDGCMGGWEFYIMQYIDSEWVDPDPSQAPNQGTGIPSTECVGYFATGEGSEHFQETGEAPDCPTQCDAGFSGTLEEAKFSPVGARHFTLLLGPGETEWCRAKREMYTNGPINFGIAAGYEFQMYTSGIYTASGACGGSANHAVTMVGFGREGTEDYWTCMNSWGPNWGESGFFRIALCVPTDFTFMGSIEPSSYSALPIPAKAA